MRFVIWIVCCMLGFMVSFSFSHSLRGDLNEGGACDCTVNINGSVMNVEDGFYYVIEGLSADQADEVQIMINNSLGK